MPKLSSELIEAAKSGRLVLFLGAGASHGARNGKGTTIPGGAELADSIVDTYLKPSYKGRDLKTVYDLACSRRDVRELQRFLRDTFEDFQPTAAHKLLPKFAWHGIATTNYDLLVERSYEGSDTLVPVTRDGIIPLDALPEGKLVYLKLHGCLTEHEDIRHPLITSTEQILDHANGRSNMFKTLREWGQNYPIVVIGYGMSDDNLRAIFYDLIKERDGRPRHFLVRPSWDEIEYDYWKERRFEPIEADLAGFLEALASEMPPGGLPLSHLAQKMRRTSLSRFIAHAGAAESDHLAGALGTVLTHVTGESKGNGSPKAFYSGVNQGWYPIESGLDARRSANDEAIKKFILSSRQNKSPVLNLLRGHAGAGKSISLKRIAWEAAKTYEKLVLFLKPGQQLDFDALAEIAALTNDRIFLFIDDVEDHADAVKHLMDRAAVQQWPITIVGAARLNEWNFTEQEVGIVADEIVTIDYLSKSEIIELVLLLEEHAALGELEKLNPEERVERFTQFAGRQLLVALHEATHGGSFEDILEDEYNGIPSSEAKIVYLDICALHRFGPAVRAGLISRIHGISFSDFERRLFKPLENVVITTQRGGYGDFLYQARHNYIAEIVFNRAAPTAAHKQEIILRIIDRINTDYSYDELVLYQLISARTLATIIPDVPMGTAIYEAAQRSIGRTVRLLHQWSLYEMRLAGDRGGLDRAAALLAEALEMEPNFTGIQHSLAELTFRRSELARSDLEAASLRSDAARIAKRLASKAETSYPHHTLAKIALAELKQALADDTVAATSLSSQAVNRAVQEAEAVIRAGLGRFPSDPFLLTAEAELAGALHNADRALASLRKAFEQSPKSELVANRLAILLMARDEFAEAEVVLRSAIAANPGSAVLNFKYAMNLMRLVPGADIESPSRILFHLKRAYRPGRANREVQFWYARQLMLSGQEAEGREIFEAIKGYKSPAAAKNSDGAVVMGADGSPRIMSGQVVYVDGNHAIIEQVHPKMRVYARREGPLFDVLNLDLGSHVEFHLSFNSFGPIAIELRLAR